MSGREFRTRESYEAERTTRDMLPAFLSGRGFRNIRDDRMRNGMTESQVIHATAPSGEKRRMRVKLCWRRTDSKRRFAVQLVAKIKNGEWEGTLQRFVDRANRDGCTHFLFIQRESESITAAALVPLSELVKIWCAQRDVSKSLIADGRLGRRRKNHAMNGSSPTLWLEDDDARSVTNVLWEHPGVQNLVHLELTNSGGMELSLESRFDDTSGIDYSLLGRDDAAKTLAISLQIRRDQRVRVVVLQRARRKCEGCGIAKEYPGFLDVHHILGAGKSDRVWNCVAICPNCHREAHAAPNRDEINARFLEVAMKSKELGGAAARGDA